MHRRIYVVAMALWLISSAVPVSGDDQGSGVAPPADAPPEVAAVSVTLGGLVTPDTGYAVVNGAYSLDRLTYYADAILDIGLPTWDDGSSGTYLGMGGSVGLRLTALPGGRGLLAGVAIGGGYSSLTVDSGGVLSTVSDWQIGIAPQFGVRFGRESGLYGEAVMRLLLPLKPVFIYTDDTPPDTDLTGSYSIFRYHAVYMPAAIAVGRFYLGVGYTFGL